MNAEQEIRAKLGDFAADQDLMRDVYMTDSQRAAYQRILSRALEQREGWRPIETAPKYGRQLILLLTPSRFPQVAFSDSWWRCGFSVECKPTHWHPIEELPAAPAPKENDND